MTIPFGLFPAIRTFVSANIAALQHLPQSELSGITLTSWHRTPAMNRNVGGDEESQHLFALATDWGGVSDKIAFMRAMRDMGLQAIDEGDHVHVQAFRPGVLRTYGFFPHHS